MEAIEVTKIFKFEAAHRLPKYEGACSNLHGHSYKLEVTVRSTEKYLFELFKGEEDTSNLTANEYMVLDFKDLSKIVKEKIIENVDHRFLNELFAFPTAENMVYTFAHAIKKELPQGVTLTRVRLWETDTSYADYIEVVDNV